MVRIIFWVTIEIRGVHIVVKLGTCNFSTRKAITRGMHANYIFFLKVFKICMEGISLKSCIKVACAYKHFVQKHGEK